jgi:hypothetical protein
MDNCSFSDEGTRSSSYNEQMRSLGSVRSLPRDHTLFPSGSALWVTRNNRHTIIDHHPTRTFIYWNIGACMHG